MGMGWNKNYLPHKGRKWGGCICVWSMCGEQSMLTKCPLIKDSELTAHARSPAWQSCVQRKPAPATRVPGLTLSPGPLISYRDLQKWVPENTSIIYHLYKIGLSNHTPSFIFAFSYTHKPNNNEKERLCKYVVIIEVMNVLFLNLSVCFFGWQLAVYKTMWV